MRRRPEDAGPRRRPRTVAARRASTSSPSAAATSPAGSPTPGRWRAGPGSRSAWTRPRSPPPTSTTPWTSSTPREAALGHAADGGWWAIGLRRPHPEAFRGVPMSTARTGRAQQARLRALGLDVALLPTLVDLDTTADLPAVVASGAAARTARLASDLGLVPVPAAVRGGRLMSASTLLDAPAAPLRPCVRPPAVPPLVLRTHTGEALVLDRARWHAPATAEERDAAEHRQRPGHRPRLRAGPGGDQPGRRGRGRPGRRLVALRGGPGPAAGRSRPGGRRLRSPAPRGPVGHLPALRRHHRHRRRPHPPPGPLPPADRARGTGDRRGRAPRHRLAPPHRLVRA